MIRSKWLHRGIELLMLLADERLPRLEQLAVCRQRLHPPGRLGSRASLVDFLLMVQGVTTASLSRTALS